MGDSEDVFEDWEDAFLDQLIQVEEHALSSISKPSPIPSHPLNPPTTSTSTSLPPQSRPHLIQQPPHSVAASSSHIDVSFSPPREFSQRCNDFDSLQHSPGNAKCPPSLAVAPISRGPDKEKDNEIERLKWELGQASKQLALFPPITSLARQSHHHHIQQPPHSVAASSSHIDVSHSPPRELSQRSNGFDSLQHSPNGPAKCPSLAVAPISRRPDKEKDNEIEGLKRELGQASKQLALLEKECLELKKERDKKDEQLKFVALKNEEGNGRANHSKSINMDRRNFAPDHRGISRKVQNGESSKVQAAESSYKAAGVQTDLDTQKEAQNILNAEVPARLELSEKLLAIWGSLGEQKRGSNVISKLLVGCQRDFHILFGLMPINLPSKITTKFLTDRSSSGVLLQYIKECFHTPEATKVSQLYHTLTKITEGTAVLETLFEPLLDLCSVENVVVVHSSLCILHIYLKLLLELEKDSGRRDNVLVEGVCLENNIVDSCGLESARDGKLSYMHTNETSHAGGDQVQPELFDVEILSKRRRWNDWNSLQPQVNWVCLFEAMHHVAMKMTEDSVRMEAVSIMNVILLRSNAYTDRERFEQKMAFDTISHLLKRDVGLCVKQLALRLLYLLLNCPKLLATFCCGCKEGECASAMGDNASTSGLPQFSSILQGLADCIASRGTRLQATANESPSVDGDEWDDGSKKREGRRRLYFQELKLCRSAILVLAFLASSGKAGFDILIGHRLSRGTNYLLLILQVLVSQVDEEAKLVSQVDEEAGEELLENFRERTFLMREILILLNRLVSSPSYSAIVLRVLTSTRDMASMTIDVANRLSRKCKTMKGNGSMVNHTRETEIVELGRVFKKRVFTYLGDDS